VIVRTEPRAGSLAATRQSALAYVTAAVGSLALTSLVLKLWNADFTAPFAYQRDAVQNLMLIKTTLLEGWPLDNPLLGAPFGQDLHDFPVVAGDVSQLLLIKALGTFSSNPAVVMNLFYLAQFPLIAVSALWALRRLGVGTWIAVACALLFACAPYHFYRGETHVFLAAYWSVPLGMYLVVRLLTGNDLPRDRTLVVVAVIIGMSEVYYAALTTLLLAIAVAVAFHRSERRGPGLSGIVAIGVIALTVAAAHAPTIVYHARHGQNTEIQKSREPEQSERFGMKTARLVVPVDGHRIGPLARVAAAYERRAPAQLDDGPPQALGTFGAIAFVALLVIALAAVVPQARAITRDPLMQAAAAVVLLATLVGASGGLNGLVSYFVTHTIRSWNRYSVFIAFATLVPIAWVLARAQLAIARRGWPVPVYVALLVAVVVLGTFDQAGKTVVPHYGQTAERWRAERDLVHSIEARLPDGAQIYQVPYVPFPEWGYDQARGYLHSDSLRWSFGAIEGRPGDWARALLAQPADVVVPSVAAAGFDGIWVDRSRYPDHGRSADADLTGLLGPPALVSADERLSFYDLRPYAARVRRALGPDAGRLARLTLAPPRAVFGPQWGPLTPDGSIFAAGNSRWTDRPHGWFDVYNPTPLPLAVRLQGTLETGVTGARLTMTLPSGERIRQRVGVAGVALDRQIVLAPGANRFSLGAVIGVTAARKSYIGISNMRLMAVRAQVLAAGAAGKAGT
jgi:hypothetical protein